MNTRIDYIEFKTNDISKVKSFYNKCFGWKFTDYGPTYTSFSESGVAGGFEYSEDPISNGALIVLYHKDLENILEEVKSAGGRITKDIFSFPGGRRFHFHDPVGNELAIWSEN